MNDEPNDNPRDNPSSEPASEGPELEMFRKLNQLKSDQPEELRDIDRLLSELQKTTLELKRTIRNFDPAHQKLLSVLVARGIYRAVREILVEESVDAEL